MNFMRKNKRYRWAIQGMGLLILLWGILVDLPKAIPEDILWEAANSAGMEAYQQGRYSEARQWFLQALEESQREQVPNPRQAMTLNNLAAVHEVLGEYEEAKLRFRQSLTVIETIQGPRHPDLIPGLNNLAALYSGRGQPYQAELLLRRSLKIDEDTLGRMHPHLIPPLLELARVIEAQGRYDEAEAVYAKTLQIAEQKLSPDHPQTAAILKRYAALLRETHQDEKALLLEERARNSKSNLAPSDLPSAE